MDDASIKTGADLSEKRRGVAVIGRFSAPLILLLAGLQFAVIILRSLFGETASWLEESVVFVHVAIVALAIGWTLAENRHVRIDALAGLTAGRLQQRVERAGLILTAIACLIAIFLTWDFVAASWSVWEGSREIGGLPGVFLLKTLMPLMFALLGLAACQRLWGVR